jgi:hypothetical protein
MPRAVNPSIATGESLLSMYAEKKLCRMFLEKIDPIFKILHAPSLRTFILDGKPYLDYEPGHLAPTALACAVYFAAACSVSEEESLSLFGCNKSFLVARYQQEAETTLARADFMTSNDLTILQAFVLFLVSALMSALRTFSNRLVNPVSFSVPRLKSTGLDYDEHGPSNWSSTVTPFP